jgi:hypothetical protein
MTIAFATLAIPPVWVSETILLVESLRTFGGNLAEQTVLILTLKGKPLSKKAVKLLEGWDVEWAEFEMNEEAHKFPLATVAHGAAAAESALHGRTELLTWLLPDTLILNEPSDFLLPAHHQLGYRPVHHQNIGSGYNQPPDSFWQQIYQHCAVPEERIFQMETCYREEVRPYFNAGILVTRPEKGILTSWLETFQKTFRHPDFVQFFSQRKYAIFMHQAILAGVVLNKVSTDQMTELPENFNYPLHMHLNYPQTWRPYSLNQLVTVRYERTRHLPGFLNNIQVGPPLSQWLKEKSMLG